MNLIHCCFCGSTFPTTMPNLIACPFCLASGAWSEVLTPIEFADALLREANPEACQWQRAFAFIREYKGIHCDLHIDGGSDWYKDALYDLLAELRDFCSANELTPEPWMAEDWTPGAEEPEEPGMGDD